MEFFKTDVGGDVIIDHVLAVQGAAPLIAIRMAAIGEARGADAIGIATAVIDVDAFKADLELVGSLPHDDRVDGRAVVAGVAVIFRPDGPVQNR